MTGPQDLNEALPALDREYNAAELREARRKARQLGLNPKNGIEAVQMLLQKGITLSVPEGAPSISDSPENSIGQITPERIIASNPQAPSQPGGGLISTTQKNTLPVRRNPNAQLPATQAREERQAEISKLQERMIKRRNQRMLGMVFRFLSFILIPTLIFGFYEYRIATPLYATDAQVSIETATGTEGQGAGSAIDLSKFMGDQDTLELQNYMASRHIFALLEKDFDLPALFMGDNVDRFTHVEPNISEEERFKVYSKYVKSIYDPTERILRLEVKTPDPESGKKIAELLISYTEDRVGEKSDTVKGQTAERARKAYEQAQADLDAVKEQQLALQGELDENPDALAQNQILQSQLAEQETLLNQKKIQLRQLENNESPNEIRVRGVKSEIEAIEKNMDDIRAQFGTTGTSGRTVLELDQEMQLVQADLAAKIATVETQRQFYLAAEAEAREQKKFLTTILPPTPSFEPVYPKKLFSTLSVFFILFAVYLFIGMTIDVIKETIAT